MKKIYICAALGLFFASCSTEESANTSTEEVKTVNVAASISWVDVMNEIEVACESNVEYKDVEDLIEQVTKIATSNTAFNGIAGKYVEPTAEELTYLMLTDDSAAIQNMNYSMEVKTYLEELIVEKEPWTVEPTKDSNLSNVEIHLLTTLRDINDPDDEWNTKKPIAIAYGYQESIGKAVIAAVLVKEYTKISKN
ncbi:hypothetical protein [Myroides sp. DW712]|uniref:hypothetical protein n=1 Tax=Myroides sp. DW712 TaxID=3389800 RepID=UPI00397D57CA